jgi:hypothetical protein
VTAMIDEPALVNNILEHIVLPMAIPSLKAARMVPEGHFVTGADSQETLPDCNDFCATNTADSRLY